jgi:hypothetical protein
MTGAEAVRILDVLKRAYPRQTIERGTLELYAELLGDLDFAATLAAVRRIVTTGQWFPSIAEIRAEATKTAEVRPALDAWEDVKRAFVAVGHCGRPEFDDPLVRRAVECLGWQSLCVSTNETADRARFCELYSDLAKREQTRRQLGAAALPEGPRGVRALGPGEKSAGLVLVKGGTR